MTPLGERLAAQIAATGPITVAEFMATALADPEHGYYRTARAVGADGDFITAPEISQLFGEMIGAWMVDLWLRSGRPTPFRLIELGPGRGTLMADIVRTARVSPEFLAAASIHLVEINPALRALQAEKLGDFAPIWHEVSRTCRRAGRCWSATNFSTRCRSDSWSGDMEVGANGWWMSTRTADSASSSGRM